MMGACIYLPLVVLLTSRPSLFGSGELRCRRRLRSRLISAAPYVFGCWDRVLGLHAGFARCEMRYVPYHVATPSSSQDGDDRT